MEDIQQMPPEFPETKPGKKTSELWFAVVSTVLALARVYGLIGVEESEAWQGLVEALILVLPSIIYTWSRTKVKTNALGYG